MMNGIITAKIIIISVIAFLVGSIVYTAITKDDDYLLERLKKRHNTQRKRSFFDDILEIIKPVAVANLKTNKNKDLIRKMFVQLGKSATETDIIDFENKKILRLIITLFITGAISLFYGIVMPRNILTTVFCFGIVICPSLYIYRRPTTALQVALKKKAKAFEKYFPDAIDLLCVCVEAGLSIDSAIERVGREFSNFSYDVGYEFSRIAQDMLSGVSKQDSLRAFSERVENKDIQSFVAIVIQADRMGASIAHSLAISADSLRTKRKQRLEAQVASASTKMTIPLVLCLLPATFAVVLTPAIIQVVESLGKMNGFQ